MNQSPTNHNSSNEPVEYETKKGCLVLTLAIAVCVILTILFIILAGIDSATLN